MSTYITLLSSIIDNIVLYLYFQTMFEKRKDKVRFYWLILAFLLSDFIFWKITAPFNGDVSNMVTFFRTSLTNLRTFLLSFFFVSGFIYRVLVIVSYSIIISICEELAYYIIAHFTDVTIQFDTLPEITFTSISFICDLLIILIIMIIHIIKKKKAGVKSKNMQHF